MVCDNPSVLKHLMVYIFFNNSVIIGAVVFKRAFSGNKIEFRIFLHHFLRGPRLFGSYGDNEKANAFSLSRNEKVLTQHIFLPASQPLEECRLNCKSALIKHTSVV